MGEIVNKAKLAAILGKSERALTEWQKEGMPIDKNGARGQSNLYNTAKVIEWMIKRATDSTGEMERAKLRLIVAQATSAELDVQEKQGTLITVDAMKLMWASVLGSFRARILSIPSRLTPQISGLRDPKKIDKLLKDTLHDALNELAEYDPTHNIKAKAGRKGSPKNSSGTNAS